MQHCSKQNVTAKPLHIFCSTAANIYAVPLQHIYSGTAKKLAVAGKLDYKKNPKPTFRPNLERSLLTFQ